MKLVSFRFLRSSGALFAGVLVCPFLLHAQTLRTFTSQFSFGDSLSDNGNLFAFTQGTQPPAPYFNGRFSNGPVFTELLRPGLQPAATAPASARTNLNFAFAGATAASPSQVPTLAQQLGLMQQRGISPAASDLFTVLAGANDMLDTLSNPATQTPAAVTAAATAAAGGVTSAVQTLLGTGARNILVLNLPNIARTARFTTGSAAPAAPLAQAGSLAFNSTIRSRLGALAVPADARLTLFDLAGFFDHVLTQAKAFGFTTSDQEYVGRLAAGQNPGDVNGYIFWDGIHPTTRIHRLLAQALTETLNPEVVLATAAPQGIALLAVDASEAAALHQHLDTTRRLPTGGAFNAWFDYTYHQGSRDSATGSATRAWTPGFEFDLDAHTLGFDAKFGGGFTAGLAVTSSQLQTRLPGIGGFHARGKSGALYAAWQGGAWFATATAAYGSHELTGIRRTTLLGGPPTNATTDAARRSASVRIGREIGRGTSPRLQSWVELSRARVEIDPYTESGVPSLNFNFDGSTADSTDAAAGLTLDYAVNSPVNAKPLKFGFDAAYRAQISSDDRVLRGALADTIAPATSVRLDDGNGRRFHLGAHLDGPLGKRWGWAAGYTIELRNDGDAGHRVNLTLGTRF